MPDSDKISKKNGDFPKQPGALWGILGHFAALRWVKFRKFSAFLRQYRHFFEMPPHHPPRGVGHFRTLWNI
jgi:hypothetical protein